MLRLLLPLLLLTGCSPGPERVVERRVSEEPAPRGEALLRAAMMAGHNDARAQAGLAPLRWNDALAADARAYAGLLARERRFEHSPMPRGNPPQGENLWTGTRDAYAYGEMAGHWVAEKRYYRARPLPAASSTGAFGDVGHYTQIMWRGTTEFGCAMASNSRDDYLVCRYTPAGNVVGQMAF